MEQGNFAEACPKLAESLALDRQVGTMLNLAVCYEQTGKTASACSMWRSASAGAARKFQSDREEFARQQAEAICLTAPKIRVEVAPQAAGAALEVAIDGAPLPRDGLGSPFSLDAGEHELRAEAPGFVPDVERFVVQPGSADAPSTVVVPALAPVHAPPSPAAPVTPIATGSRSVPAAVWVAGGLGVVSLAVSGAFGLVALNDVNAAWRDGDCVRDNCNATGVDARHRAAQAANVSTVALGVGLAALATGAVLWLVRPGAQPASGAVAKPHVSFNPWGLSVEGAW